MVPKTQDLTLRNPASRRTTLLLMLRLAPLLFATGCFALALRWSWHWPLVHDGAIMHYVVFLMDHGVAPYRDIIDINMPGAYMGEWLVVHTFGPGAFAWRMYDLSLMLVSIAALVYITLPWDWMAGAVAGLALGVFHMANGAIELGQRDYTIMALILLGYASCFRALRRSQPWPMFCFGLFFSAAASIKPIVAPFPLLLLGLAVNTLHRKRVRIGMYVANALLGACIPIMASIAFLLAWHAYTPFTILLHKLVIFYTGVANPPFGNLLKSALGRFLDVLVLLAFGISAWLGSWRRQETWVLALGLVFGATLFFSQRKGFSYQKGTLMVFALLWIALQCYQAIHRGGLARAVGLAGISLCCFWIACRWLPAVWTSSFDESRMVSLQRRLEALGGSSLDRDVQCMEMVQGCVGDLYRMRLVQSTGFLSDFFLFRQDHIPFVDELRSRLLTDLNNRPPRVIVLSAFVWDEKTYSYKSLANWPEFASFLRDHYDEIAEERGPGGAIDFFSYRIYQRR